MTTAARWSLTVTSTLAVFVGTAFAAGYSGIEFNDTHYKRLDDFLPTLTSHFVFVAPWAPIASVVVFLAGAYASIRRADTTVIVIASTAWLFAFSWALACVLAWRLPYALIGERLS